MKVPLEWLKEYVTIRLSPEALAERLTMSGLEVTAVERTEHGAVFDIEVTPNRADCLSIIGLAREIAAIAGQYLKLPSASSSKPQAPSKGRKPAAWSLQPGAKFTVRIEDRKGCRRYIGRLIEGVAIAPSPSWMQRRLAACGVRPINSVVDITNYALLEWGQPLHAFDHDRLEGGAIIVRRARKDETIVTIDGQARNLSPDILVIADAKRPVAIAGVMGGRDGQVEQATRRILLESAQFEPALVRRMSRSLGLASESSYRFERGVDPLGVEQASRRAAHLIAQLSGGREAGIRDAGRRRRKALVMPFAPQQAARLLGVTIEPRRARRALERLGFIVRVRGARWSVSVPSYRRDAERPADLIEEIARLHGYDRLPQTLPQATLEAGQLRPAAYQQTMRLRQLCASLGLWEFVTWALVSEGELANVGWPTSREAVVRLTNPLSRDHALLRPTLLVGLLRAIAKNLAQGVRSVRCFELGNVFEASPHPRETLRVGLGLSGLWEQSWQGAQPSDLYRLKGLLEQLVARSSRRRLEVKAAPLSWAQPGQSLQLLLDGRTIGFAGEAHRRVCEAFDVDKPVWFGELSVEILLSRAASLAHVAAPSPFPAVKRDLSFLVDRRIAFAELDGLIRSVASPLAASVELADRYTGPQVPTNQQSLTFSIEYRDPSRTLTAAEVERVHAAIIQALTERFAVRLRT